VAYLDQLLALPHAYIWLPCLAFFAVGGGIFWLSRLSPRISAEPAEKDMTFQSVVVEKKDQRGAFRRHGNPVQVFLAKPDDKNDPATGSVLDRSVGGVRLALFHEVEIGVVLSIRPINAEDMVPWVDIEIRSCRPSVEMPGQFEVGCQYVKSPPYSIQLLFG
jgi:hypothetical protein